MWERRKRNWLGLGFVCAAQLRAEKGEEKAADIFEAWLQKDLASGEWSKKSKTLASSVGASTKVNQVCLALASSVVCMF